MPKPIIDHPLDHISWPASDFSHIPYSVFCDPKVYAQEQEVLFRGPAWHHLGLQVEIPQSDDFHITYVGKCPSHCYP